MHVSRLKVLCTESFKTLKIEKIKSYPHTSRNPNDLQLRPVRNPSAISANHLSAIRLDEHISQKIHKNVGFRKRSGSI